MDIYYSRGNNEGGCYDSRVKNNVNIIGGFNTIPAGRWHNFGVTELTMEFEGISSIHPRVYIYRSYILVLEWLYILDCVSKQSGKSNGTIGDFMKTKGISLLTCKKLNIVKVSG